MRANSRSRLLHRGRGLLCALAVTALAGLLTSGPARAAGTAGTVTLSAINGSGSTYAYPALNQWATDLERQGLSINYNPNGSALGRQNYIDSLVNFAGSDIAFLTSGDADPFAGVDANSIQFAYSYIPDVAGGLSFLYNVQVGGQKITDLRLSGETLAKIFTGEITNWDDPAITHDYGKQLPSIPITVVARSDGAGESYFLTNWMLHAGYAQEWESYCKAQGGGSLCDTTPTEFYPYQHPGFKGLDGANEVAGYIESPSNNGAIGYAEYSYALPDHIPVVSMLNAAGYYVQPTASNVAIALQSAQINEDQSSVDFLMQNLDNVYTSKDPRVYPLSSYSYLIVPRDSRTVDGQTYAPKGDTPGTDATLSTYINYILCQAQQTAGQLGYSPLPGPMVTGGFLQDEHIPSAVPSPAAKNYSGCDNPAFMDGKDVLTASAPQPLPCQKDTASLAAFDSCATQTGKPGGSNPGSRTGASSGSPGAGGPGSGAAGGTTPGGSTGPEGRSSPGPGGPSAGPSGAIINPNTGQVEAGSAPGAANQVYAQPVGLEGQPTEQWAFGVLTALELVAVVAVPTAFGGWLEVRRRRRGRDVRPAGGTTGTGQPG